jgi:23S rRNA-/tRNA-specific pseudouridylate synthase
LPSVGNFIRAGLLHRLDKDTDGLMIIAKTEK